jgi:hypothetical protein
MANPHARTRKRQEFEELVYGSPTRRMVAGRKGISLPGDGFPWLSMTCLRHAVPVQRPSQLAENTELQRRLR